MSHDKTKAAARKRVTETGEPYAAARRAVAADHQGGGPIPSSGAGCALRMSGEIRDWLVDLPSSNPRAAMRVTQALAALMEEGVRLDEPLVVSTADSWPWALAEALDQSYQESLERVNAVRRGAAEAVTLVKDIQDQAAELESAQASNLAAAQQPAAELRLLLQRVIKARDRLVKATHQLQARADALRARKETLKASYVAAQRLLEVHQAIASWGPAGDDSDQEQEDAGEAISTAEATLADATAQLERELGQEGWPEGLMELRPGAPVRSDIRILFAVEPAGTALLIAVLEGIDVVEEQFPEAVIASAGVLRLVRAGQAPEAVAHGYDTTRSFLAEADPGHVGRDSAEPATLHSTPGIRD